MCLKGNSYVVFENNIVASKTQDGILALKAKQKLLETNEN